LALAIVVAASAACRTPGARPDLLPDFSDGKAARKGVLHPVKKGQTLWRIAKVYGVAEQAIAEYNDLSEPFVLSVDQALWIPGAGRVLEVPPAPLPLPSVPRAAAVSPPADEPPRVATHRGRFAWPVQGVVFSHFGVRDGVQHDGLDIAAPEGTPVRAADAGEVLFVGERGGYGNLVLLRHADGLITVYAHNARNRTVAGAKVARGEHLADVGRTGRATGPHLHFEVREDRMPRNPLFYLP